MAVKYGGLLKFTDEIKAEINLAADGTVEKAVVIDGDGTETPISGGDTDFTTAEVTLTNNSSKPVRVFLSCIMTNPNSETEIIGSSIVSLTSNEEVTVQAVLYKGKTQGDIYQEAGTTAYSGGVERVGTGASRVFTVTAAGSITFANKG